MNERFGLPAHVLQRIFRVLAAQPKVEAVKLYGSRARGDYRPNSDIDLCVIGPDLSLADILNLENQLDDLLLPWTIDLVLHGSIENQQLLANIDRDGVDMPLDFGACI